MKHVFESLEDTFQFGKFKGFTLREVYTGNTTVDPELLFSYLNKLLDNQSGKLIIPIRFSKNFRVKHLDKNSITFENTNFEKIELMNKFKEVSKIKGIETLLIDLALQLEKKIEWKIPNSNYCFTDFALKEFSKITTLPGEASRAISWYIAKNDKFSINPSALESLFELDVNKFIGIKFNQIRSYEYEYKPIFISEKLQFSEKIIELNRERYISISNKCTQSQTPIKYTYNKYQGSYASDEMGYSDQDIDDIFDGDPDAYWNID